MGDLMHKSFGLRAKAAAGAEVTPEMLAKINGFALKELTAEEVYVRKFLLAHNAVDRDRERFCEQLLDDFVRTLPGKSFLFAHDRRGFLPLGLFFDASAEEVAPEQFKVLAGEDARLPEGRSTVKVLWGWVYMLKVDGDSLAANIDAGVYRHVSIGFSAADLAPVKGPFNETLYWEYAAPGEALEGSLVWLGAQPGATAQKALKDKHEKGEPTMKKILVLLGGVLGKSFGDDTTENQLADAVKGALSAKDTEIADLKAQVESGKAAAELGKKYEEKQVSEYARLKALFKECEETPEAAEKVKGFGRKMGIDFLEEEIKAMEKRVEEKFPGGQIDTTDPEKGKKGADDNPLIVND